MVLSLEICCFHRQFILINIYHLYIELSHKTLELRNILIKKNILGHAPSSTGGEGSESGVSPPPDRPELSPPGSGRTMSGELPAPGSYPHPSSGDRLVGKLCKNI